MATRGELRSARFASFLSGRRADAGQQGGEVEDNTRRDDVPTLPSSIRVFGSTAKPKSDPSRTLPAPTSQPMQLPPATEAVAASRPVTAAAFPAPATSTVASAAVAPASAPPAPSAATAASTLTAGVGPGMRAMPGGQMQQRPRAAWNVSLTVFIKMGLDRFKALYVCICDVVCALLAIHCTHVGYNACAVRSAISRSGSTRS